ncbi:MAG: F0F1 ATP synthase subunit epsilon [Anaerolineae bacterium]|nr:F0F1 ATP synthase subunit epsilon [Anaerolineae bacterium]
MRLRVLAPTQIVVDEEVARVSAESLNGAFTILPRHIDYATVIVPGILSFRRLVGPGRPGVPHPGVDGRTDHYVAVDEGILVKRGRVVHVSTRNAVSGTSLESLRSAVRAMFEELDDEERQARNALARLELGFSRRYLELSANR